MADNAHHAHDNHAAGGMDISQHMKTWLGFWAGMKWGTVGLIVLAALLFAFRTHNG